MTYATKSDLIATSIIDEMSDAQVTAHLDEAISLIDSYLRDSYSVPPSTSKCTVDIAVCVILQSLGHQPDGVIGI